jgi:hypothetical protein
MERSEDRKRRAAAATAADAADAYGSDRRSCTAQQKMALGAMTPAAAAKGANAVARLPAMVGPPIIHPS